MVALQPLIQELIYRHLIIHELGKKLLMVIVLSIVIVSVQVYDLISIMEVIPYLILSIGSIIIYIRSGKSLAASYLYHSSVHLVIFITTMVESSFNF